MTPARSDGALYIAMRYVDGTDLRRLLLAEGPLTPERAVAIAGQIAGGARCGARSRPRPPGREAVERPDRPV